MNCLRLALLAAALLFTGVVARPGTVHHRGSGSMVDARHHWTHNEIRKEARCGYESCPAPKDGMLNIHLVPHSHDDVGWLKTVDQYYYGSKTNHQMAGVQYILDSVVEALSKNPDRKFIYVESAFFFKWWDEQTAEIQELVHELVREGRLEFVGGAWSMNDEAASHYQSLIDQFTWGLRLLNDTFGECGRPRAGWQIDPFGHSREQASLFAQMGYDGTFFARLDWRDKSKRLQDKTAEMLWKSSANLDDSDLFTSVLYNHYSAPPGFCFDVLCRDDPFVDGAQSAENNVKQKVDDFLTFVTNMSARYRSDNLIITMGDDFNYMDANMNFKNMDKLIRYTNARQATGSNVNVFYSTPTCYLKAVHDADLTWPTKTDDFFPYASDPHAYWTGYFTSRPTSKRMERHGNHLLQVCKQLTAFNPTPGSEEHLTILREAIGVMQHHDAVTGTEKQHVTDDYSRMLHVAFEACGVNTNAALQALTKNDVKFESCHLLNISQCEISETKENFVVTLYNPLAQANYQYVRLPVTGNSYVVKDHQGLELPSQLVSLPEPVADLFYRTGLSTQELVFLANDVPPMGYRSYYVSETYDSVPPPNDDDTSKEQTVSIGNNYLTLNFDENGFLSTIQIGDETHRLQQDFLYYEGAYGNNEVFENRSSGAYIFRPNSTEKHVATTVRLDVIKGDLVQEVHQQFNEWISQVIRVHENEMHVEFEWMVGPIPIDDSKGKEIITRYYSDIQSDGVFWTDSNGREMIRRQRNHRETWDLELVEPIAGNYYPVTTKMALEDDKLRMAVLNDRAQGGTSMEDGVIELMVHRRLLRDDAFGVGEALNETAYGTGLIARGKHYLVFGSTAPQMMPVQVWERVLQNHVLLPPWMFLSDASDMSFDEWQTNYVNMSCPAPKDGMLNIHLVPHSHDDVGWLKTVDQYYYGSKTNHQMAGVQYILDSVVEALSKNPDRKFIYVESAFFFKWWDEQTAEIQELVHELVREGRLEFVGGAWSMNDEAASHYQSLIDQFTWGLRLLNDTFGECGRPRAGWQIDPFGHSREQASLFAQMGYDGTFFARLDWRDKSKRLQDKTAEMLWKSSANLDDSDLFTSVLYNHYSAPPGFCFDVLCRDDPFVDGAQSAENNVKQKVDDFLTFVTNMSARYRSDNLIITMGDDFNYMDANMNFKNMDKLIRYTNARQATGSNVNVFYSTPTCYLKAVHDADLTWPTKTDDFFPYASDPHAYWTGYFTSRPTSKRMERHGNHLLQVCKQLTAFNPTPGSEEHLTILREAIGVMQHHDAVTGTEKQHVTDDYSRMLHVAFEACGVNTNAALQALTKNDVKFESCHLLNISQCEISETKENFVVTLYNPLAQANYQYVRLPVTGNSYVVKDHQGLELPSQLVSLPEPVADLFYRTGLSTQELVFLANDVPPMGYRSYYVSETYDSVPPPNDDDTSKEQTVSIGNNYLTLNFDENGFLSTIQIGDETHRLQQDFLYYEGAYGNNEVFENRSSGAYIFRPNSTEKHVATTVRLDVIKGDLVQEVHQQFNEWISQVIRVHENEMHVEFEWMVGPIPIDDSKGKEIITRYYSDIQSDGVFWTDSNGREMIRRQRNHRETWDLELVEPIAGNYYPVTTKMALEDDKLRMAVLNDRAQGGTSMEDGVIELMVHRRLLRDDAFGVGEALNETAYGTGLIARGKHYLVFGSTAPQMMPVQVWERVLQNHVLLPPWMFLSDASDMSFDEWQTNYVNMFSAMAASLPANVNLLTFEGWKQPSTYLVRFEHLFEKDEDSLYSAPITLDLEVVFSEFDIASIRETTLAGNQWKEENTRLKFYADPVPVPEPTIKQTSHRNDNSMKVKLNPMEIKTFVIEMNWK